MNLMQGLLSIFFLSSALAQADEIDLTLIDQAKDQFYVRVYLPEMKGPPSVHCATYYKGRLLHQAAAKHQEYTHLLAMSFINEPVFVQCSHPDYEDTGGELGLAYSYQNQVKRSLYLGFDKPHPTQGVQPIYDQQKRIAGIRYAVEIPQPYLENVTIPGVGSFQKIVFKNFDLPYLKGEEFEMTPEVPVLSPLVVLPWKAQPGGITMSYESAYIFEGVKLLPVQPPSSGAFAPDSREPFDADTYMNAKIRVGTTLYNQRIDAQSYHLRKALTHIVNYDQRTGRLEIPKNIQVNISFQDSSPCYLYDSYGRDEVSQLLGKDLPLLLRQAVNYQHVSGTEPCRIFRNRLDSNRQLNERSAHDRRDIVIVTHPKFLASAETLRKHKQQLGWHSEVLSVSDLDLQRLRSQLQEMQPQWVIMLGDAEYLATYYHDRKPYVINRFDRSFAAGDNYFAQKEDDRLNPGNFAIGRLPVDTTQQAEAVVKKIINYEINPPSSAEFYERPAWSANIEYATALEDYYRQRARNFGINPRRFYEQLDAEIPTDWTHLTDSDTNWASSAMYINDQLSQGKSSVLLHRGHADWFSWQSPKYQIEDVDSLYAADSRYPFILSINCSSGFFDNETASRQSVPPSPPRRGHSPYSDAKDTDITLAEALFRKADGALGVIADTRASDTLLNRTLSEGAFDYFLQSSVLEGDSLKAGRLGQILLAAKTEVVSKHSSPTEIATQLLIYNLMGDPSIYLHREPPFSIKEFQFDGTTLSGRFQIINDSCADCSLSQALERPIMISLSNDEEILHRSLGKVFSDNLGRYSINFNLQGAELADANMLTISGPGLIPFKHPISKVLPNLRIDAIRGTNILWPGPNASSSITIDVSNTSPAIAQGSMDRPGERGYMIDLVLSTDENLPQSWAIYSPEYREDVLLRGGRISNTQGIAAGQTRNFKQVSLDIPRNTPPGRYCLGIVLDPGNDVEESNENDNRRCHWIDVLRPIL